VIKAALPEHGARGGEDEVEHARTDASANRRVEGEDAGSEHERPRVRFDLTMRIERTRENVFTIVASGRELSALVAGARMALDVMRTAPQPVPADALEALERVLRDFDRARERLGREDRTGG
jgi:hypothetical protein